MSQLRYTPLEEIDKIHDELKGTFRSGKTKSIAYRKYLLVQLMYLLHDNVGRFEDALKADLGRPPLESQLFETSLSLSEIRNTYSNIDKWVKPETAPFSPTWSAMRPVILKEPKGVVLVIGPFNYPVFLSVPLVASAIAAGNTVIVKPSEQTPATSGLLAELIHKYLDPSIVRVVNGAIPETTRLLEKPWGHIMYTGSGKVGKIVSGAAAKTLTPVTLELGGKSPVFIDPNYDLKAAARRILWGKVTNAGQTCVAPDYIMVTPDLQDRLVQAFKEVYEEFYSTEKGPRDEGAYARLVTPQALARVNGLLQNSKGEIVLGGEVDEALKFMAPTIVKNVKPDDSLMSEEIFGPVLPIMPVRDVDAAIAYVNDNDHPLTLYVFSEDKKFKEKVFSNTLSGSAVANETLIVPAVEGLPFGGVGPSGSGYHTGKYGFDTFTHFRATFDSPKWIDIIFGFRYPPYTSKSIVGLKKVYNVRLPPRPTGPPGPDADAQQENLEKWLGWLKFFIVPAIAGGIFKRDFILQQLRAIQGWRLAG
ncbi:Hexadecenal dehydrogenase [Marasmius crinis-equi]|uniref:Aldehyde dehydrogenase n=1 Tax=Marasmius crinis-equi TaxID=585013 RepID=A0ABR3EZB4_9AGAR